MRLGASSSHAPSERSSSSSFVDLASGRIGFLATRVPGRDFARLKDEAGTLEKVRTGSGRGKTGVTTERVGRARTPGNAMMRDEASLRVTKGVFMV